MENEVVQKHYNEFLEEHRAEWIEQGKKIIEQFPFLTLTSVMPFPNEVRVWKEELHLDGYIYLFNNEAGKFILNMNSDPKSVEKQVAILEDVYFQDNTEECPYFLQANTFEAFLSAFARDFEKLEQENIELRKRLGEDVNEYREYPCFKDDCGISNKE